MENLSVILIFGLFSATLPYIAVQSFIIARGDQPLGYLLSALLSFCAITAIVHSPAKLKAMVIVLTAIGCILAAVRNSRTRP